jgi:hypothetical protein
MGDVADHDMPGRPWTAQPPPEGGEGPVVHDLVIEDFLARGWPDLAEDMAGRLEFGRRKYQNDGLRCNDGRNTVADALEEALDTAVYLRKAREEGEPDLDEPYQFTLTLCRLLRRRLERPA